MYVMSFRFRHASHIAALNVIGGGDELPVAFLGLVLAVEYWTHFLYGQRMQIIMDHRALYVEAPQQESAEFYS